MEHPAEREGLVSYRGSYEHSLATFSAVLPDAIIPIENTKADILLVAGGDDALWPSDMFAKSLAERLKSTGKKVSLVYHPEAGHRVPLPGEPMLRATHHAHGGNDQADADLGGLAWNAILSLLKL